MTIAQKDATTRLATISSQELRSLSLDYQLDILRQFFNQTNPGITTYTGTGFKEYLSQCILDKSYNLPDKGSRELPRALGCLYNCGELGQLTPAALKQLKRDRQLSLAITADAVTYIKAKRSEWVEYTFNNPHFLRDAHYLHAQGAKTGVGLLIERMMAENPRKWKPTSPRVKHAAQLLGQFCRLIVEEATQQNAPKQTVR